MSPQELVDIDIVARQELRHEAARAAIEKRKAELRIQPQPTLWQRVLNKLPFTIRIERKR